MKKLGNILALGLILMFSSCMKDVDLSKKPVSGNLQDINISSTFNWSTSKTVNVNITGLPTQDLVISTLIISLNDGSMLYQEAHDMSQSKAIQIIVPNVEQSIKLKYGSEEYTLPIDNNKVDFSFIPVLQDK
ncbi:MAG: hypothetical protein HXX13_17565 [Bacteroidetes bacterium]|nr:hypothetical protein [Bacteroidota bacterium]